MPILSLLKNWRVNGEIDLHEHGYAVRNAEELQAIRIGLGKAIQSDFLSNKLLTSGIIEDDQIVMKSSQRHFWTQTDTIFDSAQPTRDGRTRTITSNYTSGKPINYFSISALGRCYEFWVHSGKRRKVEHSRLPECPRMKLFVLIGYLPLLFSLAALLLKENDHSLELLTIPFLTYVFAVARRRYITGFAKAIRLHNLWALLDRLSLDSSPRSFMREQINPLNVAADFLIIPLLCWAALRATVVQIYYVNNYPGGSYLRFLENVF